MARGIVLTTSVIVCFDIGAALMRFVAPGFFGVGSRGAYANPAAWALVTGQDFMRNHAAAHITHCACHAWPQNWAIAGGFSGLLVCCWLLRLFALPLLTRPIA